MGARIKSMPKRNVARFLRTVDAKDSFLRLVFLALVRADFAKNETECPIHSFIHSFIALFIHTLVIEPTDVFVGHSRLFSLAVP